MDIYVLVSYLIMTGIYLVDNDKIETFKDYLLFMFIFLSSPVVVPVVVGFIIGKHMNSEVLKYNKKKTNNKH